MTRMIKETQALLAHADLDEGKYGSALATLNAVLDHQGADIVPRWVPDLYELRARANAGLHNYSAAYADLREYVQRARAATDADRARSGRVLRARFRVDNEIERNASLQRELSLSKERSDLQREQLQRRTEVMAAGVALIALMIYILWPRRYTVASCSVLRPRTVSPNCRTVDALPSWPWRRSPARTRATNP